MYNISRKVLVLSTITIASLSCGFTNGHLSGLIRALQKNEDGFSLEEGQISLIAAAMTFCLVPGIVLLAVCGDKIGRRRSLSMMSLPMLLSWISVYFAKGFTILLLSRVLAGIATGGLSLLNLVIAAEFTSPKSRAFFLSLISMVSPALGTGLGHVLGVLIHWKALAIAGMLMSIAHLCLPYICVESPQWLASKGRFDECETAFRKLHGSKQSTEEELRLLIKMESGKQKSANETKMTNSVRKVLNAFKKRYFWGLMLTCFFIYVYYSVAGKVVFSNLATVILAEMTGTDDVLLYTLYVDGFILIGTSVSCVLIRKTSIRVLLFSSGLVANVVLLVLSGTLYFKNGEEYFQWINVTLLTVYFVIVHAGPYPVMEILLGELFPLDIKMWCFLIATPILACTVCASIILMPILVNVIGYHGLFLMNAVISCTCLGYFWVRLPETKGKTLQEIEMFFKTNDSDVNVLSNEQIKSLM